MPTIDAAALQTAAMPQTDEQKRTKRALTECMTALAIEPDRYTVIGQNQGPEYTVDLQNEGHCTCPDAQYNLEDEEACKHELRARFATGERAIPDWILEDDIDPLLGEHVEETATDGGTTTTPHGGHDAQDDLELVDTVGGCLVYQTLTESRDGRDVDVAKQLLGFYRVTDWDAIEDAVRARGHPAGDALHLPEFETQWGTSR